MIGSRIRQLRERMGWSQASLANKIDANVKTVKNWESEISDPSAKNIVLLAKLFSVSADYLVGLETGTPIYLDSLPVNEQNRLRAMCQIYISMVMNEMDVIGKK